MKRKQPLFNPKIYILLYIIVFSSFIIPKEKISHGFYLFICLLAIPISILLFLDVYNPLEKNRNAFLWKLRVLFWGAPDQENNKKL